MCVCGVCVCIDIVCVYMVSKPNVYNLRAVIESVCIELHSRCLYRLIADSFQVVERGARSVTTHVDDRDDGRSASRRPRVSRPSSDPIIQLPPMRVCVRRLDAAVLRSEDHSA